MITLNFNTIWDKHPEMLHLSSDKGRISMRSIPCSIYYLAASTIDNQRCTFVGLASIDPVIAAPSCPNQ